MKKYRKLFKIMFAVAVLCAGSAGAALVGQLGILDLTANDGINPATGNPWQAGDSYRLVFITSARHDALSSDINTYNDWVQGLADASTAYNIGAADGAAWRVIGSTAAVDARDNTSTNPNDATGHAIFLLDGSTVVANNYADLWDGEINHIIDQTEAGSALAHWPFTGTLSDGTKRTGGTAIREPLGETGGVGVGQGNGGSATQWVYRVNTSQPAGDALHMYAMSDELHVVAEPAGEGQGGTILLIGSGLLFMVRRKALGK